MAIDNYENADYKDTDDRGRVTLGKEHANSKVAVAWTEVEAPDPENARTPSEDERRVLTELAKWARDNDYNALDFDPWKGRVYTGAAQWVDASVKGLDDE